MTDQPLSAPSEDAPQPTTFCVHGGWADLCNMCKLDSLRAALARVEQELDDERFQLKMLRITNDMVNLAWDQEYADRVKAEAERDAAQAQIAALTARAEQAEERERACFDAGIAAAESAVAEISAAGRPSSFALGLAAAGEAIHALFDDDDEAWEAAQRSAADAPSDPTPGTQDETRREP